MSTPNIALTLNEFFKIARISKPSYYLLEKQGKGPKVVRLGRKVLILEETAREWLKSLEVESSPAKEKVADSRVTQAEHATGVVAAPVASHADAPVVRVVSMPPRIAGKASEGFDRRQRPGPF